MGSDRKCKRCLTIRDETVKTITAWLRAGPPKPRKEVMKQDPLLKTSYEITMQVLKHAADAVEGAIVEPPDKGRPIGRIE